MNPRRTLQTTFWAMLALQTIGSVDAPGSGGRKMPAPRAYVAIVALWAILNLVGEGGYGRAAARLSLLVLLAGAVLGPFGTRAVGFLETIATRFATQPASSTSSAPAQPTEVLV